MSKQSHQDMHGGYELPAILPWHVDGGWDGTDAGGNPYVLINAERLRAWMCDMVRWGERVRADIIRLEAPAKIPAGDPGDPPPPPWK
ncbi:MAG: hypothetical protein L0271_24155 [Gemmatimonadetes bacterium]|nr:hypothetical protein [Gemmatimonadota bacterium]